MTAITYTAQTSLIKSEQSHAVTNRGGALIHGEISPEGAVESGVLSRDWRCAAEGALRRRSSLGAQGLESAADEER
jgi:hypothetical protein